MFAVLSELYRLGGADEKATRQAIASWASATRAPLAVPLVPRFDMIFNWLLNYFKSVLNENKNWAWKFNVQSTKRIEIYLKKQLYSIRFDRAKNEANLFFELQFSNVLNKLLIRFLSIVISSKSSWSITNEVLI